MFFELPKGWDQYFSTQDNQLVQGICVLKSNPFTFWYFCPKTGSKRPKNGPKMSLIGMVWFDMARLWSWVMAVPKFLFNLSKITNLKVGFSGVLEVLWNSLQEAAVIYFFRSDQFRSQPSHTKPYHTKPRHFKPIFGLFGLLLGQKYQKVNGFDLRTHIPWTNWVSRVEKYWSHPLGNSKNIISVQQTCGWLMQISARCSINALYNNQDRYVSGFMPDTD